MKLLEIAAMPTVLNGTHESLYRSYHILDKVIEMLEAGTPAEVILPIVAELREAGKDTPQAAVAFAEFLKDAANELQDALNTDAP